MGSSSFRSLSLVLLLLVGVFVLPAGSASAQTTQAGVGATVPEQIAAASGIRVGCVNFSYIAANSKQGKAAFAELTVLSRKKEAEIAERAKALEDEQGRLQRESAGLDASARAGRQRTFEKARLEFDRFRQDSQSEVQQFAERVEKELQARLFPVVDRVSRERGLQLVFDVQSPGLVWFDKAIDLSEEIVKRLDAER
jgi:outer membrane protein